MSKDLPENLFKVTKVNKNEMSEEVDLDDFAIQNAAQDNSNHETGSAKSHSHSLNGEQLDMIERAQREEAKGEDQIIVNDSQQSDILLE